MPWLRDDCGEWFNTDFAATARQCHTSGSNGTPRWQFCTADGKTIGVITTSALSRAIAPDYERPLGQPSPSPKRERAPTA